MARADGQRLALASHGIKGAGRARLLEVCLRLTGVDLSLADQEVAAVSAMHLEEIKEYQFRQLKRIIDSAFASSAAYRTVFQRSGITPSLFRTWEDLERLPVIEREALQEFSTDEWSVGGRAAVWRMTSGSTGRPLELGLEAKGYAMQLAVRRQLLRSAGLDFGSREARLWGRPERALRRMTRDALLNRKTFRFDVADEADRLKQIEALRSFRPSYLYGYASLLSYLSAEWLRLNYSKIKVSAVISTAEILHPYQRKAIERAFNCSVINEYGCSELDVIAYECVQGVMHVAPTNVVVEVDTSGSGSELIVSGLQTRLMPLLRYRIGDLGSVSWGQCGCGRTSQIIENLRGRTADQIIQLPDAARMHSAVFSDIIHELCPDPFPISAFRVVQEGPTKFHWYVDSSGHSQQVALEKALVSRTCQLIKVPVSVAVTFGPIPSMRNGKFTDFIALREDS